MSLRAAFLVVLFAGCTPRGAPHDSGAPTDSQSAEDTGDSGTPTAPSLSLLELHPTAHGTFGRVLPRDQRFRLGFVGFDRAHTLQDYDPDWQPIGEERPISEAGPREPDMELIDGVEGLLHVRLTEEDGTPGVEVRRLDEDLAELTSTGPLASGSDERALDVSLIEADQRVWLGTEYREDGARGEAHIPPEPELERGLLLRELSTELELLATHRLTATIPDASPTGQFWGLGAAQLRDQDAHWVFAAAASGADEYFDQGESAGTRRIWALEYDPEFTLRAVHGPLTPADQDAYWCTGVARQGDLLLLSYTFRIPEDGPVLGPPHPDGGRIGLLLADRELQVLQRLELTDLDSDAIAGGRGGHRSSIATQGDRIFVTWDDSDTVRVQELALEPAQR